MIRQDIKELKTGIPELRKFGLLVGAVFTGLGILFWARGKGHYPYFLAPGVLLMVLGLTTPKILKPIYLAWMSMAIVLGFIVSNVLLTIFFFLVMMPIGLIAQMAGKDFLGLRLDRKAPSYWIARQRKTSKTELERQF
jgi:hypothetical protein